MEITLEVLDKLRKDARNKIVISIVIVGVVAYLLYMFEVNKIVSGLIGLPILIAVTVISLMAYDKFRKAFKNSIVINILKKVFSNLVFSPDKGMPRQVINETELVFMGDSYKSNDFMQATYKGVNFYQADVHILEDVESVDSDGHSSTHHETVFKGRWMIFEFNKTFKKNVQVSEKTFLNTARSRSYVRSYKKQQLEDIEFNKQFDTYAQEAVDAFYILTPQMMERIKKINTLLRGNIALGFINNRLHVAFHNNQDSFEHNVFFKLDLSKIEAKILRDINVITSFVDELNLENDLFKEVI